MGYVIAAILVLLIVGGFVLFLVTNATRKSNVSDAGDPGADQNSLAIIGADDETAAGDTSQLSDEHGEEGTEVDGRKAAAPERWPLRSHGRATRRGWRSRRPKVHTLTFWTASRSIEFVSVWNANLSGTTASSR